MLSGMLMSCWGATGLRKETNKQQHGTAQQQYVPSFAGLKRTGLAKSFQTS